MNHIYKVIWSRTKHQYVVASELARSVTHAAGGHMGRAAAAILAAIVLTAGAGMTAQAKEVDIPVYGLAGITHNGNAHLSTESVQEVLNGETLNLGGLTINDSSVLTEAAMDGYVEWEKDDQGQTTDKINGVELKDGAITADAVKTTHGADLDDVYKRTQGIKGNAYMTNIRDMLVVNSAGASIPGLNGETAIQMGKDGIITVSNDVKTADGVSLVGLNKTVEENAKGVVKWDPDGKGGYQEGTLKGVQFTGDGNLTVADFTASSDAEVKGALTVQGKTTINADVDVKGNGKFDGKVTAGEDATFAAGSDDLVTAGQLYEAGIIPGKVEAKQGTTITEGESMALGKDSLVNANNSIAIGPDAKATNANATAVGPQSWASGNHSSAFGVQSHASAEGSLALGYNTNAQAKNSVALGAGSIANEADTISVGRYSKDSPQDNFTRRITNVSDGVNDTDAATVGQLKSKIGEETEGMVKWDTDAEGNYQEGTLKGVTMNNGSITTAKNAVSNIGGVALGAGRIDADGGIIDDLTTNTITAKDSIQVGDSLNPLETTRIDGGSVSTGTAYVQDKLIANKAYIGRESDENAVATMGDLTNQVGEATEGVVKWDTDAEGNYHEGLLKGVNFQGNGIVSMGTGVNTILLNGTTGQIVANSMGANQIVTKAFSAGNGAVHVDEEGNLSAGNGDVTVSAAGEVSMKNGSGELVSLTDSKGLTMTTSGDYGTGMLTLDNGRVSLMGGTTTTVTIDGNGTTFGTLFGDAKTTISGDHITTGEVTGLGNTNWTGTTDDESRAATEGQLADLSDELNSSIDTATEGVVKWDNLDEEAGQIKGVTFEGDGDLKAADLTADSISAMDGHFKVDEEGISFRTEDAVDLNTYHYYFDMNNENGISFGHSNGASMSLNENGVTFAYGDKATHINGDEISTGTVHAGLVQANDTLPVRRTL